MRASRLGYFVSVLCCLVPHLVHCQSKEPVVKVGHSVLSNEFSKDPKQAVDEKYSAKIKEYTTSSEFLSPLVSYLPASRTVPTPDKVLGDIAGAPNFLPYSSQVVDYFRLLEKSTPRVKVFSIGKSEEGREMIAAAVADEALMGRMEENRARLAKLADPV